MQPHHAKSALHAMLPQQLLAAQKYSTSREASQQSLRNSRHAVGFDVHGLPTAQLQRPNKQTNI